MCQAPCAATEQVSHADAQALLVALASVKQSRSCCKRPTLHPSTATLSEHGLCTERCTNRPLDTQQVTGCHSGCSAHRYNGELTTRPAVHGAMLSAALKNNWHMPRASRQVLGRLGLAGQGVHRHRGAASVCVLTPHRDFRMLDKLPPEVRRLLLTRLGLSGHIEKPSITWCLCCCSCLPATNLHARSLCRHCVCSSNSVRLPAGARKSAVGTASKRRGTASACVAIGPCACFEASLVSRETLVLWTYKRCPWTHKRNAVYCAYLFTMRTTRPCESLWGLLQEL